MAAEETTQLGGKELDFPSTSWTLIRESADPDSPLWRERMSALLGGYWKPVYHYIRTRWRKSNEDAKDLTQGFFASLMDGQDLRKAAREHGTFRSYLKAVLSHFLVDEHRREGALKRGGGSAHEALDLSSLEEVLPDPGSETPDAAFDRSWIATVMENGMKDLQAALRAEGREVYFRVFEAYYGISHPKNESGSSPNTHEVLGESTHEALSRRFGMATHDVNNHLVYARRKLRLLLKERISAYAASDRDALAELGFILGE